MWLDFFHYLSLVRGLLTCFQLFRCELLYFIFRVFSASDHTFFYWLLFLPCLRPCLCIVLYLEPGCSKSGGLNLVHSMSHGLWFICGFCFDIIRGQMSLRRNCTMFFSCSLESRWIPQYLTFCFARITPPKMDCG